MRKICMLMIAVLTLALTGCKEEKRPSILIVSGWQNLNVGDIAHTPGLLSTLQKNIPNADLTVWIWKNDSTAPSVGAFIQKHYPDVRIVLGDVNDDLTVTTKEVEDAMDAADLMIHGSGPMILGDKHLEAFKKRTGKPYGIFGTTIQWTTPKLTELLNGAKFIYTRETASLDSLKSFGISGPKIIRSVPDAVFTLEMNNDKAAEDWLAANNLKEKEYLCVIPRLRRTPYAHFSVKELAKINHLNDSCKELDHAKIRDVMTQWVRQTKKKVVVCAEMTYQIPLMDELLIDKLPEDVKPYVTKHGYWWPDEAISFLRRAFALVSIECHSVIMSLANGTPAFYVRQPEDTVKGQMYYDLGFADWVFEIDNTSGQQIADRLLEIYNNPLPAYELIRKNIVHAAELDDAGAQDIKKLMVWK